MTTNAPRTCPHCGYKADRRGCRRYRELSELCTGATPFLPVIVIDVDAARAASEANAAAAALERMRPALPRPVRPGPPTTPADLVALVGEWVARRRTSGHWVPDDGDAGLTAWEWVDQLREAERTYGLAADVVAAVLPAVWLAGIAAHGREARR